jgi:hypothetical protein
VNNLENKLELRIAELEEKHRVLDEKYHSYFKS